MKKVILLLTTCSLLLTTNLCSAQYTVLFNFDTINGRVPNASLTVFGNRFYGTTLFTQWVPYYNAGNGVIFSIDTNGKNYSLLFTFNGSSDGSGPMGNLTPLGSKLYGLTAYGGASYRGCIFSFDTNVGNEKVLFSFNGTNGKWPYGSLTTLGNKLFGATNEGGVNNRGVLFSIDTNGSGYKDILDFNGSNGAWPDDLTLLGNKLYGMTYIGGLYNYGLIFSIDTNGSNYKDLFDFNGPNGKNPNCALLYSNSKFYGMTPYGGLYDSDGVVFSIDTDGTNYKVLLDFNDTNGYNPFGGLTIWGNKLHGMTYGGGFNNLGRIFSIDTNGNNYTDMYDFNNINGKHPERTLIILGNKLYGMTPIGGAQEGGVIFSIDRNTIAGVNKITPNSNTVSLYPNPSSGKFAVSITNYPNGSLRDELGIKTSLEIYNMLGQQVYMSSFGGGVRRTEEEIDLSSQPSGIYLYRVISGDGKQIANGKFIINK